jgi:hypothetical protein
VEILMWKNRDDEIVDRAVSRMLWVDFLGELLWIALIAIVAAAVGYCSVPA